MFLYVVTEREKEYRQSSGWHSISRRLEDVADDRCLIVHYTDMSPKLLAELRPWVLCHSGGGVGYDEYDVLKCRPYKDAVNTFSGAQIGFCGGHQILATFFGSRIARMRRLRAREADLAGYAAGWHKEWGIYPVRVIARDALFRGLGGSIRVQEYHSWEVKKLGPELKLLATSATCRVQAYVHRKRPLYGTQFHPEQWSDAYPDGKALLKNFFRIARKHVP